MQQNSPAPATSTTRNITICLPVNGDFTAACDSAIKLLNDPAASLSYSCIPGTTVAGCMTMLSSGLVNLVKVPGRGIYEGYKQFDVVPIVSEVFSDNPDMTYKEGYSVAMVSPAWCASVDNGSRNPKLKNLYNTNACFSGYQRDGGWQIPVGRLFLNGGMPVESNDTNVKDDAESISKFFADTCAPGFYPFFPREDSGKWNTICKGCSGGPCDTKDPFYGSTGAITCLGSNGNEVAFTEYPPIDSARGAGSFEITVTPSPPATTPSPTPTPASTTAAATPSPSPDAASLPTEESPSPSPKPDATAGAGDAVAEPPAKSPKPPKPPKSPKPPKPEDAGPAAGDGNTPDASPSPDAAGGGNRRRRFLQAANANPTVLLCPDASSADDNCKPASEYANCNLGAIPAQAFVATKAWADSADGKAVKAALALAGSGSNPAFMNAAAQAGVAPYWLVTPGTQRLAPVDVSAKDYLGSQFIDSMGAVDMVMTGQANPAAIKPGATSSDGGGGLSTAAIVGISIGVIVVVGALVTVGVIYFVKKKDGQGYKKYQDAVRDIRKI